MGPTTRQAASSLTCGSPVIGINDQLIGIAQGTCGGEKVGAHETGQGALGTGGLLGVVHTVCNADGSGRKELRLAEQRVYERRAPESP